MTTPDPPAEPPEGLTSSQAAIQLGVDPGTLKRLEQLGLISPATRDARGHRRYSPQAVAQIRGWLTGQQHERPGGQATGAPELLTNSQAAILLGVAPQTLKDWQRRGRIPPAARDERGHRRYSRTDMERLKAWLTEREAAREHDREREQ